METVFQRRGDVLLALAWARLREQRDFTVAGFAKWILDPLSFTFVYFLLFGVVLARPQFAYLLFLFCALVPWRFFTGVLGGSMGLVHSYAAPLTNRSFPRDVLPLVLVVTEGANFLVALTLFIPLMAYYSIIPTAALLWLPVVIAVLMFLSTGPAYLLTLFGLYLPDLRGAVQNLIRLGFFASTALVGTKDLPERFDVLLRANPVSGIFESFRAIIVYGQAPNPADLAYPLAVGLVLNVVGVALYRQRQHAFVKEF
jgi:lipopolysaccharide transport system permease protein